MEVRAIETILNICMNHKYLSNLIILMFSLKSVLNFSLKCHIVHLSAADALPLIKKAKQNGCQLTVETCHHYLSLTAEDIPDRATQFKCCPPIRDATNRVRIYINNLFVLLLLLLSKHTSTMTKIINFSIHYECRIF